MDTDYSKATITMDGMTFPVMKCSVDWASERKTGDYTGIAVVDYSGTVELTMTLTRRQKLRMRKWLDKVLKSTKKEKA